MRKQIGQRGRFVCHRSLRARRAIDPPEVRDEVEARAAAGEKVDAAEIRRLKKEIAARDDKLRQLFRLRRASGLLPLLQIAGYRREPALSVRLRRVGLTGPVLSPVDLVIGRHLRLVGTGLSAGRASPWRGAEEPMLAQPLRDDPSDELRARRLTILRLGGGINRLGECRRRAEADHRIPARRRPAAPFRMIRY